MKFVSVDVDDAGTVSRTLTEPAKKRLTNALPVLNAIVAATAGDEEFLAVRADFAALAKTWGCDVPADLLPAGDGDRKADETLAPPAGRKAG